MMNTRIRFIVFIACLLCLPINLVHASDKVFKVGIILPLSGDAASIGEAIKNGIHLSHEKLPAATKSRMELIFEDDRLSSFNSVAAFKKLVSNDKIDLLINFSSGTGNTLAPLADREKIPLIAMGSDKRVSASRKYVMNIWVTPEEEVRVAQREALKRGYKKIARIVTTHDGEIAIRDAFDAENKGQFDIVLDEEFPMTEKDFKPFIFKARELAQIDAIMVVLMPGQCGLFAKQLREAGIKVPLFGFETFEDSSEVKASNGALVGEWYVNGDDAESGFVKEYMQKYPKASMIVAPNGYDAIALFGAAIAQSQTRDQVNDFIHNVKDFKGALGTYSSTSDNRFTLPAAAKIVTATGFERLVD